MKTFEFLLKWTFILTAAIVLFVPAVIVIGIAVAVVLAILAIAFTIGLALLPVAIIWRLFN